MGCLPLVAALSGDLQFLNYRFCLGHMLSFNFSSPSLATIAGYWLWFLYLKYLKMESEASKEVSFEMLMLIKDIPC